ncbi:hypothetical protein EJ08DRAFT_670832 [Tothia fuscella]|uniref:Uncharacterized protein n=1 Tax=Tothia fuscella TaxID=1048955 RepID=A0A9P4NQM9_9PEZI|nr:hypothetical protein EJ08DRAFT_670832 [Tothia fuscella]
MPAPIPIRTASEPVKIPSVQTDTKPRSQPISRSQTQPRSQIQTLNSRGQHGGRKLRRADPAHRTDALPPAVAALLAVTAIPTPRSFPRRNSRQRRISIDELVQEWRREGNSPSVGRGPLDILLEPADELEGYDGSFHELDDEKEPSLISSRSVSSDSIASTPSLDAAHSTMSTVSAPSLPSFVSRKSYGETQRREKLVCSPPTEECEDHPLRPSSPADSVYAINTDNTPPRQDRTVKPKSTFKSNLTASFNALKSAAKSFSNFTAPSIPSDDMLTRSLLTSRFASEMRPKGFNGIPDPALRRYLNPTHLVEQQITSLSSPDFPSQLQAALAQSADDDEEETPPMIQMQTYSRTHKRTRKSSVGPERGGSIVLGQNLPTARQREPRENSDFLRVIVLEMSMRRVGKLDSKAPGRARIWLPPRKIVDAADGEGSGVKVKVGVPSRWVGLRYEENV